MKAPSRERFTASDPSLAANEDAVFLALSALSPSQWIVPDLLAVLPPHRAYDVLRLCAGLTFRAGELREASRPLSVYLSTGELEALFRVQDAKAFAFPSSRSLLEHVQKARCFAYSKAFGEAGAAERLGIPKYLVHSRRFFVHRKIHGGAR